MPCVPIGIIKGKKGDTGIQGVKGDKGDKGEKGDKGDAGADAEYTPETPSTLLSKMKTVDGSGSGLDADTLDGRDSSYFATAESVSGLISLADPLKLHSKIRVYKYGQLCWLIFDSWSVNVGASDSYQNINIHLPEGYRPVVDVYMGNVLPSDIRVHVTTTGNIRCYVSTSTAGSVLVGSVVYLTEE